MPKSSRHWDPSRQAEHENRDDQTGQAAPDTGATRYDAFISHAHADREVAAGLHRGLHRIGRRMGRLHALRVFREDTDLSASPDLWGGVVDAMDRSRYFVVLLSARARSSHWVNQEVDYWLQRRGPAEMLIVLAGGSIRWAASAGRFDPEHSDACPAALTQPGVLPVEPIYVDVSDDAPWDPSSAVFRDKVATLAAPIHGKTKYELSGDDQRERRRFRVLRNAALLGLVCLTLTSVVAAVVALGQRQVAIEQGDRAKQQNQRPSANATKPSP